MRGEGGRARIRKEVLETLAVREKNETYPGQLSGGERTDDYQKRLSTAQSRWAIGWKPLIVPADLSCCRYLNTKWFQFAVWEGGRNTTEGANTHNGNWRG